MNYSKRCVEFIYMYEVGSKNLGIVSLLARVRVGMEPKWDTETYMYTAVLTYK